MKIHDAHNLQDFQSLARQRLPRALYAYICNGAEDEVTLRRNRQAFEQYELLPRMLVDVSARTQGIELFGVPYASPFGISPVGLGALYSFDGDVVLAQAARQQGIPYVLSGASLTRLERVAQAAPGMWFQAYLPGDEAEIRRLLQRAADAGVQTLVITVDLPVSVNPDSYVRHGFSSPLRPSLDLLWQGLSHPRWTLGTFARTLLTHGMPHLENWRADRGNPVLSASLQKDVKNRDNFTWDHIRLARRHWAGNLVIKGLMCAEDALLAREAGANGLIVSNHGGRQADGVPATLDVLAEVVAAVPDLVVMVDSGMRRGTDVLKALALGARCVFAGRPFNLALAAGGAAGVHRAIALLREEVGRSMAHLGVATLSEMTPQRLRKRSVP